MPDRDDDDLRDVPFVPSRDYGASLERLAASPDARKAKRRKK